LRGMQLFKNNGIDRVEQTTKRRSSLNL
jgi:hypothetical protein